MDWKASDYLIVACWVVVFVLGDQTPCTNAGLYLLTNANVNGNLCRVMAHISTVHPHQHIGCIRISAVFGSEDNVDRVPAHLCDQFPDHRANNIELSAILQGRVV